MSTFLQYALQGLQIGCVFALLAVGLTLNYKTSGVFNLAFAAQAYASAAVFYVLRRDHDWALLPAAFVAVFVLGIAMAWVLDRFLYRHQRTASPLAKLVTSLGLLVAIPQIVQLFIGYGNREDPPPLAPVKDSIDFLWHITERGGARRQPDRHDRLHRRDRDRPRRAVPAGRARPADASGGREPPPAAAAGRQRRAGRAVVVGAVEPAGQPGRRAHRPAVLAARRRLPSSTSWPRRWPPA